MTLLNRHVVSEVLKVFLLVLSILTFVVILWGGLREANDQGLEPRHFLRIMPFLLPDALRFGLPAALLFAVSVVFGRMAANNEIVALKSLGISPLVIISPVLVLAFILSIVATWLNEVAVSWGRNNIQGVVVQSIEEIIYGVLRSQKTFSSRRISIIVKDVADRRLIEPIITFRGAESSPDVTLRARVAELRADKEAMLLSISCTDGTLEAPGQVRMRFHDMIERQIPLTSATQGEDMTHVPSRMPLYRIPEELENVPRELEEMRQRRAAKAALAMLEGDLAALTGPEAQVELATIASREGMVYRLETEPPRRWASGFSCLCFALVGAPMAIWRRNASFLSSFFSCFGPILVVYYPFLMFGVKQAKSGALDPAVVWLGNLVLLAAGIWLMRRVLRY